MLLHFCKILIHKKNEYKIILFMMNLKTNIKFQFMPLFLLFFKKFNYLPSSIKYKEFKYNNSNNTKYLLNIFLRHGRKCKISSLMSFFYTSYLQFLTPIKSILNTNNIVKFEFFNYFGSFFQHFTYIFLFFFSKLNKKLLKYSNYKRPRYSIHLYYVPVYRRPKALIKFAEKSLLYINKKSFSKRFLSFFQIFVNNPNALFFVKYTNFIQSFILKKKKYSLFLRS